MNIQTLQSYQEYLVEIKSAQRDEAAAYDNERYIGITSFGFTLIEVEGLLMK